MLFSILGDPITMSHWPSPLTRSASDAWLDRATQGTAEHGCSRWCVCRRDDNEVVGDVGIVYTSILDDWVYDLGYIIHHPYWRNGYALEASRGAIAWARDQSIGELVATMATDNLPSVAMAETLGMTRQFEFTNPKNLNKQTFYYSLNLSV